MTNGHHQEQESEEALHAKSVMDIVKYPSLLVVGTQRSGTTLLRLLLNSHSAIAIPEEAGFLMPYLSRNVLMDPTPLSRDEKLIFIKYLRQNKQYSRWKMGECDLDPILDVDLTMKEIIGYLYGVFAAQNGKQICGDKSPSFIRKLDLLQDAFPGARLVHIVRDGRDAYLSLKQLGDPSAANIAVASLEWSKKVSIIRNALRKLDDSVIEVRYEDLLTDPIPTLTKVCNFLGLSYEERMLDFWQHSEKFIDSAHSKLIFKPLDPSNRQKWKTRLSEKEIREYEFFSTRTLNQYDYPVLNADISLKDRIGFSLDLMIHLPPRILRIIRIASTMKLASKFGLAHDDEGLVLGRFRPPSL